MQIESKWVVWLPICKFYACSQNCEKSFVVSVGQFVRQSVCRHGETRPSLDGFLLNFTLQYFSKNLSRKFKDN